MQNGPDKKLLEKIGVSKEQLDALPRTPDDSSIVEAISGDLDLRIVIPLIKYNFINAALLYENEEEKALRNAFNQNTLTSELWEKLGEHREFYRRNAHIVAGPDKEKIIIQPQLLKGEDEKALEHLSSKYFTTLMGEQLEILRQDGTLHSTNSTLLVSVPNKTQQGTYLNFNADSEHTITAHKAISGAGIEYIKGKLSEKEQREAQNNAENFSKNIPAERISPAQEGTTVLFGRNFFYRPSPQVPKQGELAIVSTPFSAYGS